MRSCYFRFLTLGLVSLVIYVPKVLATDVSGTLSSDTTWSASGSPYVVTGSVLVSEGVKLTVEAGVETFQGTGSAVQFTDTREALLEEQYYRVRIQE